ncbi:MAG: hypothetical protein COW42_05535 [Deltaproteobacteria bacterium CG17_big_fil_post_rev_8_21_14_2_50_63_7]|nr:MAG: hypothetical protein COW42_05535 [Deltaproteobacteria bacterium CG17_big_fil_post_rev_8_21_14_2_50_63_7]
MQRTTLFLLAVVSASFLGACSNEISGKLEATGEKTFSMTPDACESGQRNGFFGVDLFVDGSRNQAIRVIESPREGVSVIVDHPDGGRLTLEKANCKTLSGHVEAQNSTINDIKNVMGNLEMDCEQQGLVIKADIHFENCH